MKVKRAYYIRQLPMRLAVTLPDGTTLITDQVPWREVREDELVHLPAIDSGAWKPEFFQPMPDYLYPFYGFEKC